jgi:hypothetical protein
MEHNFFFVNMISFQAACERAFSHHIDPAAQADYFFQFGRNYPAGNTLLRQLVNKFVNFMLGAYVNSPGRLIKNKY